MEEIRLDTDDEATLDAHGWARLKVFNRETKRWGLTDVWVLTSEAGRSQGRARILKNGGMFQLHVEATPEGRPAPIPSGWVGPRFDDPAAVSRYLWLIGDGCMWSGVAAALHEEWGATS